MTSVRSDTEAGEGTSRTSWLVAGQVKQLRRHRGMTAQQLADRCASLGAPGITTNVIANIETRRRDVSVDELLMLALALDVAPLHLLTPDGDATVRLAISPTVTVAHAEDLQQWLRGEQALPQNQARLYYEYALQ